MEATKALEKNPYWLLYDLIKNEERDGRAFVELIQAIKYYLDNEKDVQSKIDSNVKGISASSTGKSSIKTVGKKGSPEEIKYDLEVKNEELMRSRESIQTLKDIIIALVCYIEIENYRKEKRQFYKYTLDRLTRYDEEVCQSISKVW